MKRNRVTKNIEPKAPIQEVLIGKRDAIAMASGTSDYQQAYNSVNCNELDDGDEVAVYVFDHFAKVTKQNILVDL